MLNTRVLKLISALAALLALCGCARTAMPAPRDSALHSLLEARQDAVNGKNAEQYLSTVLPSDDFMQKEEANLIHAAGTLDIGDFSISATDISETADGFRANLVQSYTLGGAKRNCAYAAAFRWENGALYYCGPDFDITRNNRVIVYHTGGQAALAQQLLNEQTGVLDGMKELLGFSPAGSVGIKLYDNQEVFLQSVKLDLPGWVGGWHEYGEAIKSFTGAYGAEGSQYKSMLNHETTHRMVSELSHDNAAYWLQEGLAGVFQHWLDDPQGDYLYAEEALAQYTPFSVHKTVNLEKIGMNDHGAVMMYYASSKALAAFLLETHGWDTVRQALEYMQKFELIPVTGAEKINKTNERTDEAVKTVLGYDGDEALQAAFDGWLAAKNNKDR